MKPELSVAVQGKDLTTCRLWAITADYLRAIRAGRLAADAETWAARGKGRMAGEIAVIPIMGVLTQRGGWYGMSLESIRATFREKMADPSVKAIVFEYDTPGGEVFGVDELATEFRAARGVKPTVAAVNPLSASAGYYLTAQHDAIVVTPSGEIGSVGVYAMHMNWSGFLDQMGIEVSLVSAGEGKTAGNPFEALSEEARTDMQVDVDRYYGMFVSAVSKGRRAAGVTPDKVRDGFKAKVYGAKKAVEIGMADAVGTLDDAIRRASQLATEQAGARALSDAHFDMRRRARDRQAT